MDDVHLGRAFTFLSKAMREMCTNTDDLRTRWAKQLRVIWVVRGSDIFQMG